jgi:hypothetical protein
MTFMPTSQREDPFLSDPVDLEQLLDKLNLNGDQIAAASVEQARLFMYAATLRVQKIRKKNQAAMKLSEARIDKARSVRKRYRDNGEKITEPAIKELVERSPGVQDAQAALDTAEEWEEYTKLLVDAYRMRGQMCSSVATLVAREITMQGNLSDQFAEMRAMRSRLANKYPGTKQ